MLKMRSRTARTYSEFARTSQSSWNAVASSVKRIGPKPCRPPVSWMPSMVLTLKARDADHRIARHDTNQFFFWPADRFRRLLREHDVPRIGRGVPYTDLDLRREFESHFAQHGAG